VVKLFVGADVKTGVAVFVERTEAHQVFALAAEHHMACHHFHQIGALANLIEGVGVETGDIHGMPSWPRMG
jgi:hypothetical protein